MVRRLGRWGLSLLSVLVLVGILMMISTAMVTVYSMNLNMTQKSFNASIAESEAEAGIAELLYRITLDDPDDDTDNVDNSKKPPTVRYGLGDETIRATITPGMKPDEAYHVITFAQGTGFPHSTNNTHLNRDSGSLGRTVPDGMFHIVSTGYCRGQYRTIECLIDKPPFPFGLATSGKLTSRDPFVVKGVSTMQSLIDGEEDRPGHLLCNSAEGVEIGQSDPPRPTYISGFVKSVGSISIAQPAQVLGGLRPGSDLSTLASIDVTSFRNEGKPGVVRVLDPTYSNPQTMDIMYYFSGDLLTYEKSVKLNKAFLYVDGDLLIKGPVTGEGLLVVNGNITFQSGTTLDGSNKMAVLASGDVTIRGNNNYFTGLVYCGGDFTASNVTVVGNTIVNSPDPAKGRADLENVSIVSNAETADMTITITSSTSALAQNNGPSGVMPIIPDQGYFGFPPGSDPSVGGDSHAWIKLEEPQNKFVDGLLLELWDHPMKDPMKIPRLGAPPAGEDVGGIWAQAVALYDIASGSAEGNAALAQQLEELEELLRGAVAKGESQEDLKAQINSKKAAMDNARSAFEGLAAGLVAAVYEHKRTHADEDGVFDNGSAARTMDVTIEQRFNLNEYLPESERIKVRFWRVHNRRF